MEGANSGMRITLVAYGTGRSPQELMELLKQTGRVARRMGPRGTTEVLDYPSMMDGQDGQSDTAGRRDAWRHASDRGRPNRGLASRVTQRPVARWEVEIRDSEAARR